MLPPAPARRSAAAAGESGCIGRLQSLHLGSLRLARPVPPQLWALAAPALTSLTWHSVTSFPAAEELHLAEGPPQQLMQASGHSRQALGAGRHHCCAVFFACLGSGCCATQATGCGWWVWHAAALCLLRARLALPPTPRSPHPSAPPLYLPCLPAQAAPVPAEWVHLQQLQALQLEYAQLDVVPPAVQVSITQYGRMPYHWPRGGQVTVPAGPPKPPAEAGAPQRRPPATPPPQASPQGQQPLPPPFPCLLLQGLLHLTCLSLEGNRLTTLPVGQYLTGLERLSLANNALAEVPEGLTACSRCVVDTRLPCAWKLR